MLNKLNLVKELKEQFGFDDFQIVKLLNGAHFKDTISFDKSLIDLYNEYIRGEYYWGNYRPIDELDDFLDTLSGSLVFKLCENADDLSNGVRDYFAYSDGQLFFCSAGRLIDDMNNDKDFRNYLDNIGYFDEIKMELGKVLDRNFSKVEV